MLIFTLMNNMYDIECIRAIFGSHTMPRGSFDVLNGDTGDILNMYGASTFSYCRVGH